MSLIAQPTINQGALPPGVASESRDDLVLGVPVVVSDSGPGTNRAWTLLDKPDGSTAVLSAPTGISTSFTPDIEGTYRVQLIVDSGPTDDYVDIVGAGVQIPLPTWIGAIARYFRIPAWGETLDFNVKSAPGSGPNTRGWAYEVNQFLRAVARDGFGFLAQQAGAPVGTQSFRTINFLSGTVVDAGGGVCDVTPGASPGDAVYYNGATGSAVPTEIFIGGIPTTRLALPAPSCGLLAEALVVCKNNAGSQVGAWRIMGCFNRTTLLNQIKETVLLGPGAVDVAFGVNGNDLTITVTGISGTLFWSARLTYTETHTAI